MRSALIALLLALATLTNPAAAKEFRSYYGMQWVVTPRTNPPSTVSVHKGETVELADMLTEDLFELDAPVIVGGKPILAKGAQLATAVSQRNIRCTVGRGEAGTLSSTRRICLIDDDNDGKFERYFDVGLGQGGFDVQFTGCVPTSPAAITPATMFKIDPVKLREPMQFRVTLTAIHGVKQPKNPGVEADYSNASYEFGGSVGRNDRVWNFYTFCAPRTCRVWPGLLVNVAKEGIALRVAGQDVDGVHVQILKHLIKRGYWDMSRGNRPDSLYCPGTLFVKTDQNDF